MDQKDINTKSELADQKADQKKGIRKFILVMVVFTIGTALLLIYEISAWWIWYIYFIVWTFVELKIAKNIKLKWWWWVLIISIISLLDIVILELVG